MLKVSLLAAGSQRELFLHLVMSKWLHIFGGFRATGMFRILREDEYHVSSIDMSNIAYASSFSL